MEKSCQELELFTHFHKRVKSYGACFSAKKLCRQKLAWFNICVFARSLLRNLGLNPKTKSRLPLDALKLVPLPKEWELS